MVCIMLPDGKTIPCNTDRDRIAKRGCSVHLYEGAGHTTHFHQYKFGGAFCERMNPRSFTGRQSRKTHEFVINLIHNGKDNANRILSAICHGLLLFCICSRSWNSVCTCIFLPVAREAEISATKVWGRGTVRVSCISDTYGSACVPASIPGGGLCRVILKQVMILPASFQHVISSWT